MTVARVRRRPPVGPPRPWAFPEAESTVAPNGLRILLVDLPGQHVLSLRLALPAPVADETPGTEGSTLLMARCLDEGTTTHSATELAEVAERHGIALGAGAGEQGVHLGLEVTARHLPAAVELLLECLTEPTFPAPEVSRLVRHRLTDLAHELADPTGCAGHEFRTAYFDPQDRAHLPLGGSASTVGTLTSDLLADRHAGLSPVGGTLVLAGDLSDVPDAAGLLSSTFGSWRSTAVPAAVGGASRRAPDAERLVLVPRPGAAQTELMLGRPGPDRRTEHGWGTYQALGMLFGGAPHARLDRVLREERGYTYGMRLGFRPRRQGGQCMVGGSVRADATLPALEETLRILAVPGAELTGREVREAADYLAMTAPSRYLTADTVADELVSLLHDGLEPAVVTQTLTDLAALTVERATGAWDAVRTGPGWTVVVVGDPVALEGVARSGLADVQVAGGPPPHP